MYGSIKDDFRHVWTKPNNAVAQLILINVIFFVFSSLLYLFGFEKFSDDYLAMSSDINVLISRPWTLVTHFFMHADFGHLLWNMLYLYWFGKLIQEFLGSKKVISLFVMGALAGAVFILLAYNVYGQPPFAQHLPAVGASAGVAAIMIGAAVFMPNYTFYLLFLGPVKIKYLALIAVFLFMIGTRGSNPGGEIAHLAGAGMGWLYIVQVRKGNDIGAWVISAMNFFKALFKPSPKIKVSHRSTPKSKTKSASPSKSTRADGTSQEEIDAILDKISQRGYESLSKEEKQKLFNASK